MGKKYLVKNKIELSNISQNTLANAHCMGGLFSFFQNIQSLRVFTGKSLNASLSLLIFPTKPHFINKLTTKMLKDIFAYYIVFRIFVNML